MTPDLPDVRDLRRPSPGASVSVTVRKFAAADRHVDVHLGRGI
jgi:hypothetical protein